MKPLIPSLLFLCACTCQTLQAQHTYLQTSFSSAAERKAFTFFDVDDMPVASERVKNLVVAKTWFAGTGVNGADKSVMYSCSLRSGGQHTDNWMITPKVHVSDADAWLTWDAQSVHHHLRESYEVLVGESLDDFTSFKTVFTTDAEDYYWQHHMVSLKDYAGKDVYVAFRHTSHQKYLLAVDNVFLGQLGQKQIESNDQTAHSCGLAETAPIQGTMTNTGQDLELQAVECLLEDGNVIASQPEQKHFASGQTQSWSFNIPVRLNHGTPYRVQAVDAQGNRYSVASDSVFCTNYPRTLMLDKVTARWCVGCPSKNVEIYGLERYFGPQMVEVVTQYPDNNVNNPDPAKLVYDVYRKGLVVNAVPTLYFNRTKESSSFGLNEAIARPCDALVQIASAQLADGCISGDVHFQFASDVDNSVRRYRLGFALVEKQVASQLPQSNANTSIYSNEYYFLPNGITPPLYYYTNVVRGTDSAFKGIFTSVPTEIEARKDYAYHYSFEVPEKIYDASPSNLKVVAFMLNSSTGECINAAYSDVTASTPEGIGQAEAGEAAPLLLRVGNQCEVKSSSPVQTSVYATDGRRLFSTKASSFSLDRLPKGVYLVEMHTGQGVSQTEKIQK